MKATLALKHLSGSGGNYDLYLEASADARYGPTSSGSFYVIELQDPTPTGNGFYSATLALYKRVNGGITSMSSTAISVRDGSVLRVVYVAGYTGGNGISTLAVSNDGTFSLWASDDSVPTGQPGVGVRGVLSGNGISRVDLGPWETVAPTPVNAQRISTSSFPTRLDVHSAGTVDDPNGTGIAFYQLWRDGAVMGTYATPNCSDSSLSPATTYSYYLVAYDQHLNRSFTPFTVVTPPASSIDPREVGVRPTGSYWGGGGEKIDMRSGNLNYTIPLIKAMARSGWSASFNLSYNSQNWRQDPAGTWQLGQEVGYGYGWRLQAGSLTPVYSDFFTLHHYVFMDSTGAEYRLDTESKRLGVWTSKESIYVSFDTSTGRLYFPDGSFWKFGSTSGGSEWDAGVMYPTLMQDTNGNQVSINYNAGIGLAAANSSSRIQNIQDLRGSYSFTYNYQNAVPRLSTITNNIGTPEKYQFFYNSSSALLSPWNTQSGNFGTINLLSSLLQNGTNLTTSFAYDSSGGGYNGTGELTQVTTPYGGHLRWSYVSNTLAGSRAFREVQTRYLSQSNGAAETAINFYRDPGDTSRNVHLYGYLVDVPSNAAKAWFFQTDTSQFNAGMVIAYDERNYPNISYPFRQDFGWSATPVSGNPYINTTITTLDYTLPSQVKKQTSQTLDQHGNLTDMLVYDFGNFSTPARTYHNTYLTDSNYTSRYIFNRLTQSTVTAGTLSTTLSSISYDSQAVGAAASVGSTPAHRPCLWACTTALTAQISSIGACPIPSLLPPAQSATLTTSAVTSGTARLTVSPPPAPQRVAATTRYPQR